MVFCSACHGLWLSLVERLNGVQEVPGSNPGSPISLNLGNLLRSEEVLEDGGVSEVLQSAGSSQWGLAKFLGSLIANAKKDGDNSNCAVRGALIRRQSVENPTYHRKRQKLVPRSPRHLSSIPRDPYRGSAYACNCKHKRL